MINSFALFRNWFKTRYQVTDGPVFRLHYRLTATCLVVFTVILTARQYVGNPIDCIHSKDIDEDVLNTFCWIHATYSMRNAFKTALQPTMYPGVASSKRHNNSNEDIKIYSYYQWVTFCLFFQVCDFFF